MLGSQLAKWTLLTLLAGAMLLSTAALPTFAQAAAPATPATATHHHRHHRRHHRCHKHHRHAGATHQAPAAPGNK